MKYFSTCVTVFCILSISFLARFSYASDPKALEIMKKVEEKESGDNVISKITMILIDNKKKERVRKISTFSKKKGNDSLSITFFIHPADVRNTGFLTYSHGESEKDDDQWLYLPSLRKVKRIASSEKGGNFMGSDFSYADMSARKLDDFDFEIKGERDVRGHKTWVIQMIPRSESTIEESGYTKTYLCVRKDNNYVVQAVMVMKNDGLKKYLDVKKLEKIDGYWVATETHMTKKKGKQLIHKTILKIDSIKYNQNLSDDLFTKRRLEKGL